MTSAATPPPPSRPASKVARQARIVTILSREQVHSQEQLAGLLSQYANMRVTQATLSRDLDELGVVRLRAADGSLVYALPGDPGGHGSPAGISFGYPERARLPHSPPSPFPGGAGHPGPATPATGTFPGTAGSPAVAGTPGSPSPAGPAHAGPAHAGQAAASQDPRGPDAEATADHGDAAQAPGNRDAATHGGSAPGGTASGGVTPQSVGAQAAAPPQVVPDAHARPGAASSRLVRYLKELLTSAEASANLVVLRTPAGAAQFLASAIDHADWPAILGTVAGDDTVLVIARDPAGGESLADDFRHLAEGRRYP